MRMSLGAEDLSTLRRRGERSGRRMTHNNSHYQAHQLKRWMRPDAHRFVRPTGCTLSGPASGAGIGRGGG